MADEFQLGSGNWWDTPRTTTFETPAAATAISTTLNTIASYGWPPEMAAEAAAAAADMKSGADTAMFRHGDGGYGQYSGVAVQIISDWKQNQAFVRGDKAESNFRPLMTHNDFSTNTVDFQPAELRRRTTSYQEVCRQQKVYGGASFESSSVNQGFAFDQTQFTSNDITMTSSQNLAGAAYGGLLPSENHHHRHHQPYQNRPMYYPYPSSEYNYPPFLRSPTPKQPALHFSNNTPFCNASTSAGSAMAEASSFDEKAKSLSEIRKVGSAMKKTTVESSNKRVRSDSALPLPAFKVRKEKMRDRITALQQLVSPFGKTDTASVLSEAIEYIKYLHEQVSVLSAPYMKHATPIYHHQIMNRSKDEEGAHQNLRSRGLRLVPVPSTFPVTYESTVDFWTPTFGGTFR